MTKTPTYPFFWRVLIARSQAYWWNYQQQNQYRQLRIPDLAAKKKSDKIFIFGSGFSLNSIRAAEWKHFSRHNTMAFNWFVYQKWVSIDYYLIRELADYDFDGKLWRSQVKEYAALLKRRKFYQDSFFLVQGGWKAINGNRLIGYRGLPKKAKVFQFYNYQGKNRNLTQLTWNDGLVHASGTVSDCVHAAYLMGFKQIILVGVDLYDRRYFWLKPTETRQSDVVRKATYTDVHRTANGLIRLMADWKKFLARKRVQLYVYNPKSLLTEVLPVYRIKG